MVHVVARLFLSLISFVVEDSFDEESSTLFSSPERDEDVQPSSLRRAALPPVTRRLFELPVESPLYGGNLHEDQLQDTTTVATVSAAVGRQQCTSCNTQELSLEVFSDRLVSLENRLASTPSSGDSARKEKRKVSSRVSVSYCTELSLDFKVLCCFSSMLSVMYTRL